MTDGPVPRAALDPGDTYVQFHDGGGATPVEVDEHFWARIGERTELHGGRLVTFGRFTADPDHAEMHPAGDEYLFCHSGVIDVVLEHDDAPDEVIRLTAGRACLIPAGTWHHQVVHEPGEVLFVTPGQGTEHRPVRP